MTKTKKKLINIKDLWRMPPILDDPGKIYIMAGEVIFKIFQFAFNSSLCNDFI